jgi:all-trans-retinol dehydrogenase (NAD+)
MTDTISTLSLGTSLSLIAVLRRGPESLKGPLLQILRIQSQPDLKIFLSRLAVIASISGVIASNRILNHLARNNWLLAKQTDWDWPNEVAVVTGGSGGIGANVVQGLARKGIKVAVIDIVEPSQFSQCTSLDNIYDACYTDVGPDSNVHFFKCDITIKENVDAVAAEIKSSLGAPSILHNNAGIAHAHTILESSPGYLKKLFDINVFAHFYTIQAFLPDMIARKKGHIVSTCSMSSFITPAGLVDYAASKAAVMAIHEGLQSELKYRYNAPEIRTTVVHPTYVRTPLCDSYAKALEKSGAVQLTPETVANEIVTAILSGTSRQIILPRKLALTSALRALPYWFQELVRGSVREDMKRL